MSYFIKKFTLVILFLYVLLLVCLLHASKLTLDLVAFGGFYYEVFGPEKMGKKEISLFLPHCVYLQCDTNL